MRSKQNHWGILALTTCMSVAVMFTGCRSGKSNMFSFRSEPSPEALAGAGPTTTYPIPPSQSATPEAIASVAGGTAPMSPVTAPAGPQSRTAQVAGLDVKPGAIKPAATNLSAAQANGFHGGTQAAGFQAPSTDPPALDGILPPQVTAPKTTTSGYEFGTNPAAKSSATSGYTVPSSYTAPTPSTKLGGSASAAVSNAGGGGFALPADLGAAVATTAGTAAACTDCAGCAACAVAKPAPTITPATASGDGYSPGSTAGASGYPSSGSTYLR